MKAKLIEDILQQVKAGDCYISGDFVLMLAFRSEGELKEIASNFHIKTK